MKILVTGFDPFGGDKVNPAFEAVKLLPGTIAGAEVIKIEIPTVYGKSGEAVEEGIKKYRPDVVLCIGQAGGRSTITVERVAINLAEARIEDNEGNQPIDKPLEKDGENAYFATIPVKAMVNNIRKHGIPANISYTAGTFVCNSVMYDLLYMINKKYPEIKGGFIHVPFAPEQVVDRPDGTASLPVEITAKALEYAIEAIFVR
ncbi:pyroglutamyl-peptidase I [Clostridium sp. JN-9]|uniref:pyroglutamyl-peptidase I n=1 Tax=Clostridium sp. JN-9 TaxID=2507159 RepID=UPI000FFE1489|nr:pyroglutamyl-peptidase I [Clostridium sp. JN-9]QAT40931.1 pyroglutamyl-peptidase I [Clostridium sp. JN-9]